MEIYSSNPTEYTPEQLRKPTQEEIDECTRQTAELLGLGSTGVSVIPMNAKLHNTKPKDPVYVEYTPANATTKRIIKIQTVVEDPLAPSKFKLGKPMARPPSPPPTFVHDTRGHKPTPEEIEQWKIPTALSNWVNPKAFIVDLGVRVALDGRTYHQQQVSDKFAQLSEALASAERQSAKQAQARAMMLQQAEQLKRERLQQEITRQAQSIREAHLSTGDTPLKPDPASSAVDDGYKVKQEHPDGDEHSHGGLSLEEQAELARRDQVRERISREVAGSLNLRREDLQRMREAYASKQNERIRDISENMALGKPQGTMSKASDVGRFDDRLFDRANREQSYSGGDEGEHMYDKPLFDDVGPRNYHVYRGQDMEKELREGMAEAHMATGQGALTRTEAVQFERVGAHSSNEGRAGGVMYHHDPSPGTDRDGSRGDHDRNGGTEEDDDEPRHQHKRPRRASQPRDGLA